MAGGIARSACIDTNKPTNGGGGRRAVVEHRAWLNRTLHLSTSLGDMVKRDESYWTRKVMAYLSENHRLWLYYKLADHFTSGIPDIAVVAHGKTMWLELKCLKVGENMLERVKKDPLQFHDMCKIEDNGGHCRYLIFMPGEYMMFAMVSPGFLRHSMTFGHALVPQVYLDLSVLTNLIRGED